QIGVFNEGAESLAARGRMPQGSQQVGLAHTESAIEVDAVLGFLLLAEKLGQEGTGAVLAYGFSESLELIDRFGLRWLVRIRAIGIEGHFTKAVGRVEAGQQFFD